MRKIEAVEEAKALMSLAKDWPILNWLTEKPRVRGIADKGTAALDEAEKRVKSSWSEDLRNAYAAAVPPSSEGDPFEAAELEFVRQQAEKLPEHLKAVAQRVRQADEAATEARLAAERTFDLAERRLSASLARRGAEEAITAYELRYRAIDEAEAAALTDGCGPASRGLSPSRL